MIREEGAFLYLSTLAEAFAFSGHLGLGSEIAKVVIHTSIEHHCPLHLIFSIACEGS